ncbi:MAG: DUF87 domain-containing protein, partial [Candidatus Aenigmarchaeota archaeon]|nr:DUF87 domain-containing protein [Candidatus Aenigmarchaeota archaeon]
MDTDKTTVTISTDSFSTYIITQYQKNDYDDGSTSGGSGYSSGGGFMASCGDNVCSIGEDFVNCPKDCGLSITCGNNVCDSFETLDNCPKDCAIQGDSLISLETTLSDVNIDLDSFNLYDLWISNNQNKSIDVSIYVIGELGKFVNLDINNTQIERYSSKLFQYNVSVPSYALTGYYSGDIIVKTAFEEYSIPISMTISNKRDSKILLSVKEPVKKITVDDFVRFTVEIQNAGSRKVVNLLFENIIKNVLTDEIKYVKKSNILLENRTTTYDFEVYIDKANYSIGKYYLVSSLTEKNMDPVYTTTAFEVINPFWTKERILFSGYWIILLGLSFTLYYIYNWYVKNKRDKARYVTPLNFSKLPKESDNSFWLGKYAETNKKAFFDSSDLTTHVLVAGSTGSGKSVTASIYVEEALLKKIPVIIFDPTAQWTGFVKACNDSNLLNYYSQFGMKTQNAKMFKGMIFDVKSVDVDIDIKKYMNPGEVTVFNLSALGPGDYDQAVMHIVQKIFDTPWEES